MEVRQLRIVLILTRQQQWYQEPAKPTFARLIPIFVRFALTSGEKCPIFVSQPEKKFSFTGPEIFLRFERP